MMAALMDEPARQAALERYAVLDTPPEAQFDKITALVQTVLKVPMAAVSLIDGHRQWFKSKQGLDVPSTERRVSFCTHTIQSRAPMVVPDATLDPRFAANPLVTGKPFIRSYAGVPLTSPDGYNVGALCAIDSVPRTFEAAEIDLLSSFAALAVDELELRMIAQTDFLTGAISRRGFTGDLEQALGRKVKSGQPVALVTLDLDRFKSINDTLGHSVGDKVLVALVALCTGAARTEDVLGRMGGEEFAVLLPGAGIDEAMIVAERLRRAVAGMIVPDYPDLKVTASFGVAAATIDDSAASWMARADQALYAAKERGRNRCCQA